MENAETVVILADGGINSTVAAAQASKHGHIHLVFVDYGQPAAPTQRKAVESLVNKLDGTGPTILKLPHIETIEAIKYSTGRGTAPHSEAHRWSVSNIPGLSTAMLTAGVHVARRIGAHTVISGTSEIADQVETESAPGQGTPDHRREFFYYFSLMLETLQPGKSQVVVETPLIDVPRDEILKLGMRYDTPFGLTYSCKARPQSPCGECSGCNARMKAFKAAGLVDPALAMSSAE